MQFWQLVDFIKKDGCYIRLYDKEEMVTASCAGTFDITKNNRPLINIALRGHTQKELLRLLLHEYAHFLQWKDGFLHRLEGPQLKDGWDVLDRWLRNKQEYTIEQLAWARNAIILMEYDADLRAIKLAEKLGIDIGSHKEHVADSYSYVTLIKWTFKNKKWTYYPDNRYFPGGFIRSPLEILKDISEQEEFIITESLGENDE